MNIEDKKGGVQMTTQTITLAPHAEIVAQNRYYLKTEKGEIAETSNELFQKPLLKLMNNT